MVLTSTHNLCFEQKYEKYQNFLSKIFHFLVVKFSVYLNRHVFLMRVASPDMYQQIEEINKTHFISFRFNGKLVLWKGFALTIYLMNLL